MLQQAVGAAMDGILGPATMKNVMSANPADVISRLSQGRKAFYVDIVARDPTQGKFISGWLNRIKKTDAAARKLGA